MMTVLSGCSGSDAQNDAHKGRAVVETESGLKVLVAGPTNGSGQARVVGKLAEVEGCLGIRLGENRWVALFLSGTKVSTDREVTLPEGSPLNTWVTASRVEGLSTTIELLTSLQSCPMSATVSG